MTVSRDWSRRHAPDFVPDGDLVMAGLPEAARTTRARKNLTQAEVAKRGGLPRSTVQSIEQGSGTPQMGSFVGLVRGLGLRGVGELCDLALEEAMLRVRDAIERRHALNAPQSS